MALLLYYHTVMFIKTILKTNPKNHKRYEYYRLCEGYRIGGKVRHHSIISLGLLEGIETKEGKKLLADRIESLVKGERSLFSDDIPVVIEKYARAAYKRIADEKLMDVSASLKTGETETVTDYQEVDLNSMNHDEARELGAEWMVRQTLNQLGLSSFLQEQCGFDQRQANTAMMHLISRAVYPASEHKTAEWIIQSSAVAELCSIETAKVSRHKLYAISKQLYQHKDKLEKHLSSKTNELFDLQDTILFYDLTNTYFEGRKVNSKIAAYGRSKEKRSDAKIVSMAAVINAEGFLKYSKIYQGNIADNETLETTIQDLSAHTSGAAGKPFIVMDAAFATKENLKMLREKEYKYICVSRIRLKDYKSVKAGRPKTIVLDNRNNPIELEIVKSPDDPDTFLYVHSHKKALKEASMNDHFSKAYEQDLTQIKEALHKKKGTKKLDKVWQRIGRLKERYPSANKHYHIEVAPDEKNINARDVTWHKNAVKPKSGEGVYFVQTNLSEKNETDLWTIYNTLTEIEATFRILKTDLSLRPVFHQKDEAMEAHLFLGLVAYQLVATIRYQLKVSGIHYDWRNIVRYMNTQKLITTTMKAKDGKLIRIKKSSTPRPEAKEIYEALKYKYQPYVMKKSVVPET